MRAVSCGCTNTRKKKKGGGLGEEHTQCTMLPKGFATNVTRERFAILVDQLVLKQGLVGGEGLVADVARKGFV